jgi:kumamolisin
MAPDRALLPDSIHHLPPGSRALRATNPHQWLALTIGVRRKRALPGLAGLDPQLPARRHYLTLKDLQDNYGSDPAAITRIEFFATSHHLVVVRDDRATATLELAGTVANINAAFGVSLLDYTQAQLGSFHARTQEVSVPAELQGDITGVFGLNNHAVLSRRPRLGTATRASLAQASHPWFVPSDLAPIYSFPDADAHGQCIALLEFGGGVEEDALSEYFRRIGMPKPDVSVIALGGVATDPLAEPEATGEVMLDVEVAGALAGGARIAVYFSTFDEKGVIDAINAVINDTTHRPSVVSVSWGWDENQPFSNGILWSPAAIVHVNQSLLAAAQLGISVCVATGDDGAEAQLRDGRAHVNFPATSPYVLAVGGTTLHVATSARGATHVTEVVWNNGPGSGTGGGVSDITPRPAWQDGVVPLSINPGNFAGRGIPDVAANADPQTGYFVMSGGRYGVVGGTSAAAPLWAALLARANALLGARVGNFNALLYQKFGPAGVLRDIVTGNNDTEGLLDGRFAAKAGWDACTGWGVPDGAKLVQALGGKP